MKDTELIVAHLLGGTSGLNLQEIETDEQIREMVSKAVRVALEIERQVEALYQPLPTGKNPSSGQLEGFLCDFDGALKDICFAMLEVPNHPRKVRLRSSQIIRILRPSVRRGKSGHSHQDKGLRYRTL
jgi:hypothetical protein